MRRIDWLVLRRIMLRITITVTIFFGLFALIESLNVQKMQVLSHMGGPALALLGIVLTGLRSSIGALPVTVLIGTVAGVIDLQLRRELTVIQASGLSIWRVMFAPVLLVFAIATVVSISGDSTIISLNRAYLGAAPSRSGPIWMEQKGPDGAYILRADRATANPPAIRGVEIFMTGTPQHERIFADSAKLQGGRWQFVGATRYAPDRPPQDLKDFSLATATTIGDLRLKASGTIDLTLPELLAAAATSMSDTDSQAVTLTSLYRSFTLPVMILGSMLIGIAAASRYRRSVRYGDTVLFAVITGFVLFVVNEMAVRAGNAGVLAPIVAASGPAIVSVIVGMTALLYSQDGRT
jgi:lipopolysaccharide export system permease protein